MLCLLTESATYSAANTTADFVSQSQIAVVRYAYVTIGSMVFVAGALNAAAYCQDRFAKHTASALQQQIRTTHQTTRKEDGIEGSDVKPTKRQLPEK